MGLTYTRSSGHNNLETENAPLSKQQTIIPNTVAKTLICVDDKTDYDFSGVLYNPFMPQAVSFDNTKGMTKILEDFFDEIDFPQSTFAFRSFLNKPRPDAAPQPVVRYAPDELLACRRGTLATFLVQVRFRQHASWQGNLMWVEREQNLSFRSILELLLFMEKALNQGSSNEPE